MKATKICLLGFGVLALGCGSDKKSSGGGGSTQKETVKIGVMHTLTGDYREYGPPADSAVKLAIKEINAAGGVLGGRNLEAIYTDSRTDEKAVASPAMMLVAAKVVGVVEDNSSSISLELLKYTGPASIAQLSASSTSPELIKSGDNFFRLAPPDTLQAAVLAKQARDKGISKVAVLYEAGDSYGKGLNDAFKARFETLGGMVTQSDSFDPMASNYRDLVTRTLAGAPDAVMLPVTTGSAGKLLKEVKAQIGPRPVPKWLFPDSLHIQMFVDNLNVAKPLVEGAIGTAPTTPDDPEDKMRNATFTSAYKAEFSMDPAQYNDAGYDSVYILAAAVQRAGSTDPAMVLAQIRDVAGKQGMPAGTKFGPGQWKTGLDALTASQAVNYEGASGTCDLDEAGDPGGYYNVWSIQGGMIKDADGAVRP